jgi:hypothetical protein
MALVAALHQYGSNLGFEEFQPLGHRFFSARLLADSDRTGEEQGAGNGKRAGHGVILFYGNSREQAQLQL